MKLLILLSILCLTTISRANIVPDEPDPFLTTSKALREQYKEPIRKYTKKLEKNGEEFLEYMGINKYFAANTVLLTKVLVERKIEYNTKITSEISFELTLDGYKEMATIGLRRSF